MNVRLEVVRKVTIAKLEAALEGLIAKNDLSLFRSCIGKSVDVRKVQLLEIVEEGLKLVETDLAYGFG